MEINYTLRKIEYIKKTHVCVMLYEEKPHITAKPWKVHVIGRNIDSYETFDKKSKALKEYNEWKGDD